MIQTKFTAAVLCTAAIISSCSAAQTQQTASRSTFAASESSAPEERTSAESDAFSAAPLEVSETVPNTDPSESLSSELYAMDTVMTLTAYGPNAQTALTAAENEITRLDTLFSISSASAPTASGFSGEVLFPSVAADN